MAVSSDEIHRARVIKHMNDDHAESLSRFLQYFSKVPSKDARGAFIKDFSLSAMHLQTPNSDEFKIPLTPPLNSWDEVRDRMKEMDGMARKGLGIPELNLVPYKYPTSPLHASVMTTCLATFLIFGLTLKGDVFVPGRYFYDRILPYFPGGPEVFLSVVKLLAFPTLVIHACELWYMDNSRLKKNGIRRGTALWWRWALSCFAEGFGSFQRFDAELKRMKLGDKKTKL